jgi:hypothetical protein
MSAESLWVAESLSKDCIVEGAFHLLRTREVLKGMPSYVMGEVLIIEEVVVRAAMGEHDECNFEIDDATEPVRNKFLKFKVAAPLDRFMSDRIKLRKDIESTPVARVFSKPADGPKRRTRTKIEPQSAQ